MRRILALSIVLVVQSGCSGKLQVKDEPDAEAFVALGGGPTADAGPTEDAGPDVDIRSVPAPELSPPRPQGPSVPVLPSSPEECPASTPQGACEIEGLLCEYFGSVDGSNYYHGCGCFAANNSELWWWCSLYTAYDGVYESYPCPATEPEATDSCADATAPECLYLPHDSCSCSFSESDPTWECMTMNDNVRANGPELPVDLDLTVPVDQLDDAARQTWCHWYVDVTNGSGGFVDRSDGAVDEDGYVQGAGCTMGWDFVNQALLPKVSTTQCEQNLALSTCERPVSDLTDCVKTIRDIYPSPTGCGRYLDTPGCDGTIVVHNPFARNSNVIDDLPRACALRVE